MSMSSKTVRSAAAVALAAALFAAPAAQAASPASPLARGWQQLIRLIAPEGLGLDPNGYKLHLSTSSGGAPAVSATLRRTAAGSAARRR